MKDDNFHYRPSAGTETFAVDGAASAAVLTPTTGRTVLSVSPVWTRFVASIFLGEKKKEILSKVITTTTSSKREIQFTMAHSIRAGRRKLPKRDRNKLGSGTAKKQREQEKKLINKNGP